MRVATLQRLLLLAAAGLAAAAAAEPLKVELFGESLCDDTAHYIVDVLGEQEGGRGCLLCTATAAAWPLGCSAPPRHLALDPAAHLPPCPARRPAV